MITSIWFKRMLYAGWIAASSSMASVTFGEEVKASAAQAEQANPAPAPAAAAGSDAQKQNANAAAPVKPKELTPEKDHVGPVKIRNVYVMDPEMADFLACRDPAKNAETTAQQAPPIQKTQLLAGAGDIVLEVGKDDYKDIYDNSITRGKLPYLYIDGISLGSDGTLISQLPCGDVVYLRFEIRQGPQSKNFWAALYTTSNLTDSAFLNPSLAWDANGPVSVLTPSRRDVQIAVTSPSAFRAAVGVVLVLLGLTGWIFVKTDTFRDAPEPEYLEEARRLRSVVSRQGFKAGDLSWIQQEFPAFNSANQAQYLAAAQRLRAGILPAPGQEQDVLYGLLLDGRALPDIRATYSLARTQLGMWFMFAVSAGIFLWIIFGQLPRIDGSLLVLLGLSVSTAGVSLAIDKSAAADDKRPFTISKDLLTDLVIGGAKDKQQVYRYQAVVVNLLLLCVGVINVVQNLTYPLFDPTWLAFLGISGAALTLGKQVNET